MRFKTFDRIVSVCIIGSFLALGGKPLSPVFYKALEKRYNVELPTYNIGELIEYIDKENEKLKLKVEMSKTKIEIDTYEKFKDVLKSKSIKYTIIPNTKPGLVQLKIDSLKDVTNYNILRPSLRTRNNICISTNFLNDKELVVTLTRPLNQLNTKPAQQIISQT